jgi:transcriptional regulator with XRE-family HTH domain
MENYLESIKTTISEKRKHLEMTQEQLAERLGISYQAVSKWETGIACPDIMMLPKLAEIFQITIDELFGVVKNTSVILSHLPWDDDETLRAVAFVGHRLLEDNDPMNQTCKVKIMGNVLNVKANTMIECDNIEGNATAGATISCNNVGGDVNAGDSINCDQVAGNAKAGNTINCDSIGQNATAGYSIQCDTIGMDASAGYQINCDQVGGNIKKGGSVN